MTGDAYSSYFASRLVNAVSNTSLAIANCLFAAALNDVSFESFSQRSSFFMQLLHFCRFFLSVDTPKPSIEIALVSAIFSRVAIRVTWESKILLNVQAMRTQ